MKYDEAGCVGLAKAYIHRSGTTVKTAKKQVEAIMALCPSGGITEVEIKSGDKSVTLDKETADKARAILRGLRLIKAAE